MLSETFEEHPVFDSALNGEAVVILGRKGAGKTAFFKRIQEMHDPQKLTYVSSNTFSNYPWGLHEKIKDSGTSEEESFLGSWTYYIALELSKLILNDPNSHAWAEQDSYKILQSFLNDSYGTSNPKPEKFFNPSSGKIKMNHQFSIGPYKGETQVISIERLHSNINDVNEFVFSHLHRTMAHNHTYYVIFDELDRGFAPEKKDYQNRLIGLLLAAKKVSENAKNHGLRIYPVVFLRDDIYSILSFEDKNKLTQGSSATISWGQNASPGVPSLKNVMERRFQHVFNDPKITWEDIFQEEGEEMPSRQTKYAHMCDRTLLRPRDMIKFCNEVAKQFTAEDNREHFSRNNIHTARDGFSHYLRLELEDEAGKHLADYRDYIRVISEIGRMDFTKEKFQQTAESFDNLTGRDHDYALSVLYNLSVIGFLRKGGRGGGSSFLFKYLDPSTELQRSRDEFRVHKGLKESLQLVQSKSTDNPNETEE